MRTSLPTPTRSHPPKPGSDLATREFGTAMDAQVLPDVNAIARLPHKQILTQQTSAKQRALGELIEAGDSMSMASLSTML